MQLKQEDLLSQDNYKKFAQLCDRRVEPQAQRISYQAFLNTEFESFEPNLPQQQLLTKYKMMKSNKNRERRKKWQYVEKELLAFLVVRFSIALKLDLGNVSNLPWNQISSFMNWSAEQCKTKWLSVMQRNQLISWREEQDNLLVKLVQEEGGQIKWSRISQKFNKLSDFSLDTYRSSKHCRERWYNHLDQKVVKGNWSNEEDLQILQFIESFGKKWSYIAKQLRVSRTENAVKNRFNSLFKQAKSQSSLQNQFQIIQYLKKNKRHKIQLKNLHAKQDPVQETSTPTINYPDHVLRQDLSIFQQPVQVGSINQFQSKRASAFQFQKPTKKAPANPSISSDYGMFRVVEQQSTGFWRNALVNMQTMQILLMDIHSPGMLLVSPNMRSPFMNIQ